MITKEKKITKRKETTTFRNEHCVLQGKKKTNEIVYSKFSAKMC